MIHVEQTPKMLEMEDEDQIECMIFQEGGMTSNTHGAKFRLKGLHDRIECTTRWSHLWESGLLQHKMREWRLSSN